MRSRVYKTVRCPSVRLSVSQSVPSVKRTQQRRAAGLLLSAVRAKDIDRQRRAPGSSSAAARGRSTALSSKFGDQCYVDSRVDEAEHRWVSFYFRPIKILAVFTACVECVSGWQHARNYISTHWADWTWMDQRTKISRISSWKIWQP